MAAVLLVVALGSYVTAMLGHAIVLSRQGVSVLWPACAFLVAVLLLTPRNTWSVLIPAGLAGFVVHDLQFGFTPWTIFRLILADTIEILIICLGLGYSFHGAPRLDSSKALAKYCFFAVFLGPFISAFVVAVAMPGSPIVNGRIWFFSQTLAFLTITPAILSWVNEIRVPGFVASLPSKTEGTALIGCLVVLGYIVLLAPWKGMPSTLIYSFVPFLLWAALRFGSMGVSTSMIVISFLSIWGALHGHGPFAGQDSFRNVLSLQLFLLFAAIPFMVLAALVEERQRDQQALSSLNHKLIEAQEDERRRVAREIHDDYNQRLAMIANDLEGVAESTDGLADGAALQLHDLWNRVGELGADLHSLSHRLHSSTLENLGLVAGVRAFCNEFADQQEIEVDFAHENVPRAISNDAALCLFRITQEGLRNVKRHSGAASAEVRLHATNGNLKLSISDKGRGFDLQRLPPNAGIGIRSMEERLRFVGGNLEIRSRPNEGTRIEACVPLSVTPPQVVKNSGWIAYGK
jgi:signal transduction histidine kinase